MMSLYRNYRPMEFFGLIATLLMLVSLVFMVPIIGDYAATGLVPRFPTLITCGFVFMAGLLALFTGMVLKVVDSKDRKDFEYRLTRIHDRLESSRNNK